jgi:ADP-ribose pyrophosphatase
MNKETNYKLASSEVLFEGKVFTLKVDSIIYDSGNNGIREVAVHPGGAVIVTVNEENKILLVKQFRYPLQQWIWELPAGKLNKGEDPLHCAIRELEEETGLIPERVLKLGFICTTPGFCTEILHIYLAADLKQGTINREEGEAGMEIAYHTIEQIDEMIIRGEIYDAKTLSGLQFYRLMKDKL